MALPPTFSSRVRLQAGRVPDRMASPNPLGTTLSLIGRAGQQIGQQRHDADQQIADSQQRVREREIAREREVRKVELYDDMLAMQTERDRQRADLEERYDSKTDLNAAVTKLHDDSDSAFLNRIDDQELRGEFQMMLARDRAQSLGQADLFVRKKRAERQAVATDSIAERLQNRLLTLPATAGQADLDTAIGELDGVLAGQIGDEVQRAKIKRLYGGRLMDSFFDNRLLVGDHKGAIDVISSGKYADLMDPSQTATAMAKIQQRARAAAESQASDFKATARTTLEDVNAGVAVDPKTLEAMAGQAEAAGESDLAHDLRNGVATVKVNSVYANASPGEIAAARREIEQSGKDWRSRPDLVAAWNRLGTLEGQNRERVKNDVLGLWSASGGAVAPLDIANVGSIRARYKDARAAQQRYGGPLQVMSANEVEPLRQQFEQGGAADKAAIIANFTSVGADIGKAFLRQIAPAKPEYAWIADLSAMRNVGVGRGYAREALNGWEQLKADSTPVAGENGTKLRQAFDRELGPALLGADGPTRQAIMQVARGLYGARAAQAGVKDFDKELWGKAMRDALGAAPDGTGGIGRTRGDAPLILPRGMTQRDLDTVMARADGPRIVAAAGGTMPMWGGKRLLTGQLMDLQMEWAGDGLYRFRSASGGYAWDSDGSGPFTLDIRKLALSGRNAIASVPAPTATSDSRDAARAALQSGSLMEGLFGVRAAPPPPPKAPALKGKGSQAARDALGWGSD
ncbi:MAG: hypothetical protein WBL20_07730 [Sphingobium sp.]|uniref:hypothetical protein n=1 Tax=Sphingobium sp. TaxID=1912891 RepID=UPI003BAFAF56